MPVWLESTRVSYVLNGHGNPFDARQGIALPGIRHNVVGLDFQLVSQPTPAPKPPEEPRPPEPTCEQKCSSEYRPCVNGGTSEAICEARLSACSERCSPLPAGFYKRASNPAVYLVYAPPTRCRVQNDDQLKAYGSPAIKDVDAITTTGSAMTGTCGWPNGFFMSDGPAVYQLYGSGIDAFNVGDRFCKVRDEKQMNLFGGFGKVVTVSKDSDLFRGRANVGVCRDP